mmetsp:Transcript_24714/g.68814  ORF Transcript_24714/g.68814 Transcript_24714/m.68814 type:complete len:216 (-) Transcript_24714:23-670(-)
MNNVASSIAMITPYTTRDTTAQSTNQSTGCFGWIRTEQGNLLSDILLLVERSSVAQDPIGGFVQQPLLCIVWKEMIVSDGDDVRARIHVGITLLLILLLFWLAVWLRMDILFRVLLILDGGVGRKGIGGFLRGNNHQRCVTIIVTFDVLHDDGVGCRCSSLCRGRSRLHSLPLFCTLNDIVAFIRDVRMQFRCMDIFAGLLLLLLSTLRADRCHR